MARVPRWQRCSSLHMLFFSFGWIKFMIKMSNFSSPCAFFFFPELQSLSGPELNETCQLLDNFLDNLNFPLLSTIKIGQGTYWIELLHTSIKLILCGNHEVNSATLYQQVKELSARGSFTTEMIMIWPVWPWSPWHLSETLSTCLIISLTASTAPPQTVSIRHVSHVCYHLTHLFYLSVSSKIL